MGVLPGSAAQARFFEEAEPLPFLEGASPRVKGVFKEVLLDGDVLSEGKRQDEVGAEDGQLLGQLIWFPSFHSCTMMLPSPPDPPAGRLLPERAAVGRLQRLVGRAPPADPRPRAAAVPAVAAGARLAEAAGACVGRRRAPGAGPAAGRRAARRTPHLRAAAARGAKKARLTTSTSSPNKLQKDLTDGRGRPLS